MVDSGYEDEAPYKGKIALTFDDGPSPVCTPQLLDGLKKKGCEGDVFRYGTECGKLSGYSEKSQ